MLTYRLKNSLISSEESSWKQLVTEALGEGVHPNRVKGFCLAREALRECFSHLDIHLSVKDLVLEKFSTLKGNDSLTISLAHTSEWGAAAIAEKTFARSVGIDMEPLSRIVKPMILQRIAHPEDLDLSPLSTWTLKEAIFKSVMNTNEFDKPIEFSSLKIGNEVWSHESGLHGYWKLKTEAGLLTALAWITN